MIYLAQRFPTFNCCSEEGWSSDSEFVTDYLLRKRDVRVERQETSMQNVHVKNNTPLLYSNTDDNIADSSTPDNDITDSSAPNNNIADHSFQDFINETKQQVLNGSPELNRIIFYGKNLNLKDIYVDPVICSTTEREQQNPTSSDWNRHFVDIDEGAIRQHEIKDIFCKDREGKFPRTIMVYGAAGIGKTVLIDKIKRDWANESDTFYSGKIVLFFQFKWFRMPQYNNLSLKTFLRYRTTLSEKEFESIFEKIEKEPQKVIFIFDGLDESVDDLKTCWDQSDGIPNDPNYCTSAMILFMKLAKGSLLQGATVLATSRPNVDHTPFLYCFGRRVKLIGFNSDKIREYVHKVCYESKSDLAEKILEDITMCDLLNFCYSPINCYFAVNVILSRYSGDGGNDTAVRPKTLTKFYDMVVDHFVTERSRNMDKTSIETIRNLQTLAFEGLTKGQLVFNKKCFNEQMKKSSLVNSLSDPIFPTQTQYCFMHLTIQEFLAARHVVETFDTPDEIEKFISTHIKDSTWHLVLLFIAGLLGEKVTGTMSGGDNYYSCFSAFTNGLTVGDAELDGITVHDAELELSNYGNVVVMKCLKEVDDENIVKNVCEKTLLHFVRTINYDPSKGGYLSTSDWAAVTFICKHLDNLKHLKLRNFPFSKFLETYPAGYFLLQVSELLQQKCVESLCLLDSCTGSEGAERQLISALMECTLNHEHNLSHLALNTMAMTDECVSNICALIKKGHASHLKRLVLYSAIAKSSSEIFSQLCNVLNDGHCRELTDLVLDCNPVGDDGVRTLCSALMNGHLKKLNMLSLEYCSLTDGCVECLCKTVLDGNCKLTKLWLRGNMFTEEEKIKLRDVKIQLKVVKPGMNLKLE